MNCFIVESCEECIYCKGHLTKVDEDTKVCDRKKKEFGIATFVEQ